VAIVVIALWAISPLKGLWLINLGKPVANNNNGMNLTDTHTHLYLKEFDHDRDQVVKDAVNMGVKHMLLPNIDSSSIPGMQKMVEDFPGICYPMIGLHPTSVRPDFELELDIVSRQLKNGGYIAIGETGIDLYWDKKYKDQQIKAFEIQVGWAKEYQLPIVIHARESFQELFDVLDRLADENLKGVFHSFTGNSDEAAHVMDYGFLFGINGIITFKNSALDRVVKQIPPERILMETDSPYLAPMPFRGRRNESSYIRYIAARLADIYGISIEEMAAITTLNAKSLFKI
jgi:TatD DNase family protein